MQFEFATATRIVFGTGAFQQIGGLARELGSRALIVSRSKPESAEPVLQQLSRHAIESRVFPVSQEPTTHLVMEGVRLAREAGCDLVIGFGGGSTIDTAKAIAALLTNPGEPLDYLEVVGRGKKLVNPPAPWIAVPTTAGTGAEVTRNTVLDSPEHQVKASLRSPTMLARLALVDPELTYSLPPAVTASTGMDALTQLIEPYVSTRSNPMTDGFCREGMARAARSLRRAYEHGEDAAAREDMSVASLLSGLSLANAGLGAAHGFAGPVGGTLHAPHGAVCARLLPPVMAVNVRALKLRAPDSPVLQRYDEVARILTGRAEAAAQDGVLWVQQLCQALNNPPLSAYGMTSADLPDLVEKSAAASSMKANPIQVTREELREILESAG
jgi:alcohol dehydrogenase class IV